jgi:hypothetical protein
MAGPADLASVAVNVKQVGCGLFFCRSIVAPLLLRPYKAWSNFWGTLTADGFYARSMDYMEIIHNNRRWVLCLVFPCHTSFLTVLEQRLSLMNMGVIVVGMTFLETLCSCFLATHKFLVLILDHCGLLLCYANLLTSEASCGLSDIPKTFSFFYNVNKSPCQEA